MTSASVDPTDAAWLELVRRKVMTMRFGSIQIVVHEGRVTQVDCTERTRLAETRPPASRVARMLHCSLNPEP